MEMLLSVQIMKKNSECCYSILPANILVTMKWSVITIWFPQTHCYKKITQGSISGHGFNLNGIGFVVFNERSIFLLMHGPINQLSLIHSLHVCRAFVLVLHEYELINKLIPINFYYWVFVLCEWLNSTFVLLLRIVM